MNIVRLLLFILFLSPVLCIDQTNKTNDEIIQEIIEYFNTHVQGPDGDTGPQGVTGPQGLTGPKGDTVVGPRGDTGPQGLKGDRGPEGDRGLIGPRGQRGNDGYNGVDGVNMDKTLAESDEIKIWVGIILALMGFIVTVINFLAYCNVLKNTQSIMDQQYTRKDFTPLEHMIRNQE